MLENQEAVTGNLIAVIDCPAVGQSYRRTAFHVRRLKLMCTKMLVFLALYLEKGGIKIHTVSHLLRMGPFTPFQLNDGVNVICVWEEWFHKFLIWVFSGVRARQVELPLLSWAEAWGSGL